MKKFTKEIATLMASVAVSVSVGASSVSSEEIVQTAGVDINSSIDEDVQVDGLMMADPPEEEIPPLAGEPLPPDEYIETTSEVKEQIGTVTITVINEETGKLFTENHKSFYVEGLSSASAGSGGGAHCDVGQFNPAKANPVTFSELSTNSIFDYHVKYNGNFQENGYSRYDIDYEKSVCTFNFKNSAEKNITIYMKYSEWGKNHPEDEIDIPPLAGDLALVDGDINGDGEFNVADVVMMQKYLVGKTQPERMAIGNADMNGDGKVNVFDLVLMKRRLLNNEQITPPAPVAPPLVQPVHFKNTAELISELKEYDLDKYPEYSREGYRKMYDTIKSSGNIYEIKVNETVNIDTESGIAVVPNAKYEDLGIYSYTKDGYLIIVYYADADIKADGTADYLKQRFNQNILKEIAVNEQNVSITSFGSVEDKDTYRLCASAFIDDNHYYTVRTNVGGTEEELVMFLENLNFTSTAVTTQAPDFDPKEITFIGVSSLPESASNIREYSSTEKIGKVVSYLNGLHLQKDFPENPDEYGGMTWEIRLVFKNGNQKTICLFGNMFYREEGGDWLRMNYDEAAAFDSLIYDNPSD